MDWGVWTSSSQMQYVPLMACEALSSTPIAIIIPASNIQRAGQNLANLGILMLSLKPNGTRYGSRPFLRHAIESGSSAGRSTAKQICISAGKLCQHSMPTRRAVSSC